MQLWCSSQCAWPRQAAGERCEVAVAQCGGSGPVRWQWASKGLSKTLRPDDVITQLASAGTQTPSMMQVWILQLVHDWQL